MIRFLVLLHHFPWPKHPSSLHSQTYCTLVTDLHRYHNYRDKIPVALDTIRKTSIHIKGLAWNARAVPRQTGPAWVARGPAAGFISMLMSAIHRPLRFVFSFTPFLSRFTSLPFSV